jgi:transposase
MARDARAWQTVVGDYIQRSVTVPSNKLVAEEFQRILRTEYFAGLWRDTLLGDLLWNEHTGTHIPRPAAYRAPSWSL